MAGVRKQVDLEPALLNNYDELNGGMQVKEAQSFGTRRLHSSGAESGTGESGPGRPARRVTRV